MRRPRIRPHPTRRSGLPKPLMMISERPAEVEDRAVPGQGRGPDPRCLRALRDRHTGRARHPLRELVYLPGDHGAEAVCYGLIRTISTLPAHLRRSLTWDQGTEMAKHREFTLATAVQVYFCDPHAPWQRGSNENTNGLLRQYFPKGTDLSVHTPDDLDAVANQLNRRPRKTLGWDTPAERLANAMAVDVPSSR
ncbi:IS30 family transposase [Actinospica sp.]|uniref:IS30 family transposase n=1 Tax=Actinospica sp. TaxID=1872142 RepID=UPI002B7FFEAB|nr:IS30 family transposase [Actinospica sp.]HWG23920.1 IS30 family transposase [Actinospica sp.]